MVEVDPGPGIEDIGGQDIWISTPREELSLSGIDITKVDRQAAEHQKKILHNRMVSGSAT